MSQNTSAQYFYNTSLIQANRHFFRHANHKTENHPVGWNTILDFQPFCEPEFLAQLKWLGIDPSGTHATCTRYGTKKADNLVPGAFPLVRAARRPHQGKRPGNEVEKAEWPSG